MSLILAIPKNVFCRYCLPVDKSPVWSGPGVCDKLVSEIRIQ